MAAENVSSPRISLAAFGSRTDVGYVRERNEDSLLVAPPLFVVCDGMGGHEAGDVASEIAVTTVAAKAPKTPNAAALGRAVEEANLQIVRAAKAGRGKAGMGTTCTAAMMDGDELVIAQVGDSRAYLLHQGALQQLTRDHSVVADLVEAGEITKEEARTHQWRSYITRALGLDPHTKPDLYEIEVSEGDRLLLCSDGLYSMVDDDVIRKLMRDIPDPQKCADALVDAALSAGGSDNVTVVVADVTGDRAVRAKKTAIKGRVTAVAIVAAVLLVVGGVCGAFAYWMDNSAYLGEVDGSVAIYKGVPGELFGLEFSTLEEVTDVSLDDLQPGTAERVAMQEIRCDSLDEARSLVLEYKEDAEAIAQAKEERESGKSDSSSSSDASSAGSQAAEGSAASRASSSGSASASSSASGQSNASTDLQGRTSSGDAR